MVMATRSQSDRIRGSRNAVSSNERGSRGSRTWASATQNGMLYCAIMMSVGEAMLLTLAILSLPAMWIEATSAPS